MYIFVSDCCWADLKEDDTFCPKCKKVCIAIEIPEDDPEERNQRPEYTKPEYKYFNKTEPNGDRSIDY